MIRLPDRLGPRLALLLVMSAGLSAALAMLVMLVTAWIGAERRAHTESRQVAATLAYSVAAPLAFDDAAGIREALSTLSARPDIRAAWLRAIDGSLVQAYGEDARSLAGADGGGLWQKQLVVSAPVMGAGNDEDHIGTVTLQMDLSQTLRDLQQQTIVAGLAALCALVVAVVLSQRLARRISVPIVQLAAAARAMTVDWRTNKPLSVTGGGEIAVAITAFNKMVDELQRRDADLLKLNADLRESVQAAEAAQQQAESASQAKTRFLAEHESRAAQSAQWGDWRGPVAGGNRRQRRAAIRAGTGHPHQRQQPARHDRERPGCCPHRGRPGADRAAPIRSDRGCGIRAGTCCGVGRDEGLAVELPDRSGHFALV